MHGLLRYNINTGVRARTGGADVSLRDVTIAQMGSGVTECRWRHTPEERGGFSEFEESQRELRLDTKRDGWLSLARGGLGLVSHEMGAGADEKSQNKKIVPLLSLSLCRKTFKLKGNKKFRTWTEKSLCVFSNFEIHMFAVIYIYEHYMSISHMAVSGYGTLYTLCC